MTNFRYKVYYVFLNFGISHDFVVYFGYIGYFFNVIGIPLHPLADPVHHDYHELPFKTHFI